MLGITPPPRIIYTPHQAKKVAFAAGVLSPEDVLCGGISELVGGAAPASLVLDFGEELVGTFEIEGHADGPTTVELFYGEDLAEALVTKDPFPVDNWYRLPRDAFNLTAGSHILRHPGRRACRYLNIVASGPGKFCIRTCRATNEHAEVAALGSYSCSDELLNSAWEISRRTILLCMQQHYEDGVKRDGMLWLGDYRVEFLCASYLFGDIVLARRSLEMFAQCQKPNGSLSAAALQAGGHQQARIGYIAPGITEPNGLDRWVLDNYCADFVGAVWEYVLHTGDAALVTQLDEVIQGVLIYLENVDIAQAKSPATFITDNQIEQSDWWGSRSTLAYQVAAAFAAGSKLSKLLGNESEAQRRREVHQARLRQAIIEFGDPVRGECRDEYARDSTRSWHSYTAAMLAGALTPTEMQGSCARLAVDSTVRRPMAGFMEYWMLLALFDAGLTREALDEIRSYWGQMLRNGATTTWELIDHRVSGLDKIVVGGRSQCHGWSAGPAHLLPAKILGVTPVAPGFSEIVIRPALGGLEWARGEIPTPHGVIRVEWNASGSGEVTLPAGITGSLCLAGGETVLLKGGETRRIF